MVRLMSHGDASELLGAYALDAVDPDEAERIEAHLETCPRCRDELRNHREVVGLLAYAGQDAPEGLWDRLAARLSEESGTPAGTGLEGPPLRLFVEDAGGARGATAGRPHRRRPALMIGSLAAAAAVVVVALLGVEVGRLQQKTNHLDGQMSAMDGQPSMQSVRSALQVPGARRVVLRPVGGGGATLDAVVLPGGQGYLYDSRLQPLSSDHTYQLWGVVGGNQISYGLLGSAPAPVIPFQCSIAYLKALAVTDEVAGGVVTSSQTPVAVGVVQ